ncbi:MAG: hypothetical protein H0U46_03840, partial [Actinobacteria bacterium]|nr:hypothetical protein [Actinomycetota bacterium]
MGYRFTAERQAKPSHTWDPARSSAKFSKGSAWYRVEALGVEALGSYPTAAQPPTGQGGKHVSSVHQQDYQPSLMQYGKGDLFFWGEWAAKQAAAELSIPVYAYCSAVNARDSFFTGLTPAEARNGGWGLKDTSGNELHVKGWGSSDVACDIGSAGYQQAWANKVIAQHRDTDGAQGTFIDDLAQSPHIISGTPAKYPNQPTWRAAMESFVRAVGPKLKPAGLKVMLNTG